MTRLTTSAKTTGLSPDSQEVVITAKHSNVYYIHRLEIGFQATKKAKPVKNDLGLDLFKHNGFVYEGRSGVRLSNEMDMADIEHKIESIGGIEVIHESIEKFIANNGESPRYTRPDERKKDVFPPDPARENVVFGKDSYGNKHYFFRFEYEGIELFTLKKATEYFRQVYVQCGGYMLAIDQHHRLEEIPKMLAGLENGIKGEVERKFNESMADPRQCADLGFANILGRVDEANIHNAPILEARELERQQRDSDREAARAAGEQAAKDEYEKAITLAEFAISKRLRVENAEVQGKSLIMQLFREHEITVPLKTQGWIVNSLHDIYFDEARDEWGYHYYSKSKDSTVFPYYLALLASAVQTKEQYKEMASGDNGYEIDAAIENDNEDDMEI